MGAPGWIGSPLMQITYTHNKSNLPNHTLNNRGQGRTRTGATKTNHSFSKILAYAPARITTSKCSLLYQLRYTRPVNGEYQLSGPVFPVVTTLNVPM